MAISGKLTVAAIVCALVFTGVAIPTLLHLPKWIELESALAAWLVIWTIALAVLLYKGVDVADDADRINMDKPRFPWLKSSAEGAFLGLNLAGCFPEFLGAAFIIIVVATMAGYLLVELLIPCILLLAYLAVRGMLTHVLNQHRCEGRILASATWGLLWAAFYTVPLAAIVFCARR